MAGRISHVLVCEEGQPLLADDGACAHRAPRLLHAACLQSDHHERGHAGKALTFPEIPVRVPLWKCLLSWLLPDNYWVYALNPKHPRQNSLFLPRILDSYVVPGRQKYVT